LSETDIIELNEGAKRVADLMQDGRWHDAEDIRIAAGTDGEPASEGLRRARELRDIPGIDLERRSKGGRLFEYRLTREPF